MSRSSNLSLTGIILGSIADFLFFPFWWYSIGLFKTIKKMVFFIADKEKSLGLFIWIKNIFVPMYGQRDIQGFIISFFIRLIQIIVRTIILLIFIIIALIALLAWLIFPLVVVYMIYWQIFSH